MKPERSDLVLGLGKALLKTGAFKIGIFTIPSGKTSPYYIDLRNVTSFPEAYNFAVECLRWSMNDLGISPNSLDAVCGIPMTGLLLSAPLAIELKRSLVYPTKDNRNKVHGILKPGSSVLVVDDVSETGISIRSAAQALRSSGAVVARALTLIDRMEEASGVLRKSDLELHYFTTTGELTRILMENMALSEEQEEAITPESTRPRGSLSHA